MDTLNSEISYPSFFDKLKQSSSSLLMLDYDGTLSPFTPDRDNAVPYEGVRERLTELSAITDNRVVIISGRAVSVVQKLLNLDCEIEIWGSHGAERKRPGHEMEYTLDVSLIERGLMEIDGWTIENGLQSDVERKPLGRAFHWRGESGNRGVEIARKVQSAWSAKTAEFGLVMHHFDGGLELRPSSVSKADAVRILVDESDETTMIAYLGDDLTDEDAFAQLGDRGLKLLVRKEMRTTKADLRLTPPDELLKFLDDWLLAAKSRKE